MSENSLTIFRTDRKEDDNRRVETLPRSGMNRMFTPVGFHIFDE
jgi:2-C-methyl-D-erythritol 4-phosphate cytidylyltransferase